MEIFFTIQKNQPSQMFFETWFKRSFLISLSVKFEGKGLQILDAKQQNTNKRRGKSFVNR